MDGQQIDEMLHEHMGLVEKVARHHFTLRADDEDLLQCGRIGLWEAAKTWTGKSPFERYAVACIKHNKLAYLRSTKKNGPTMEPPEQEPDPDEEAEEKQLGQIDLSAKIERLPPNSREKFILTALSNGVSKSAIAIALNLDRHTVTRIAKRAWEKIKEEPD